MTKATFDDALADLGFERNWSESWSCRYPQSGQYHYVQWINEDMVHLSLHDARSGAIISSDESSPDMILGMLRSVPAA